MNRKLIGISAAALAVIAGVVVLAGNRSDRPEVAIAAEPTHASTVVAQPVAQTAGSTPEAATLPAGDNATEVYTALTQEIASISQQAMQPGATPESQMRAYGLIESKLQAFRKKFANTPEANDAVFQLGALSFSVQKYPDAKRYLSEFLTKASPAERDKTAYARFYLAETNRAQGDYNAAEKDYKLILAQYRDVNPRLTQLVQSNMDGLESERRLAVGSEPVAFSVKSTTGQTLAPAAYKGKVLLIDFWATWCGPCVKEMPNVKSVYDKYHSKGFEIVGISLDQSREKMDAYIKQQGLEWPQYFDGKFWNNDVAVMYGVKSIPTTVLVDKKGKIRYKSLRGKQLETAVETLLNEKV